MYQSIDGGKERSVQPSSSLADELWYCVGGICFANSRLDVFENPVCFGFGTGCQSALMNGINLHNLKAEHTVFCQVHVGGERVRTTTGEVLALEV